MPGTFILTAVRTHSDGRVVRWSLTAAAEQFVLEKSPSPDGVDRTTFDQLAQALEHDPELTELPPGSRTVVELVEEELSPLQWCRLLTSRHRGPAWGQNHALATVNGHAVHFLPLQWELVAVLKDSRGAVVGRRLASASWAVEGVSGRQDLIELGPGLAASQTGRGGVPDLLFLGFGPAQRSESTLAWLEATVEPGVLLFEPAVDDPARPDWLKARADQRFELEFSFGDDTDDLLLSRKLAVVHPVGDVVRVESHPIAESA